MQIQEFADPVVEGRTESRLEPRWAHRDQAAGYVEYAVLAAVGAFIVLAGVTNLGTTIVQVFGRIASAVAGI